MSRNEALREALVSTLIALDVQSAESASKIIEGVMRGEDHTELRVAAAREDAGRILDHPYMRIVLDA